MGSLRNVFVSRSALKAYGVLKVECAREYFAARPVRSIPRGKSPCYTFSKKLDGPRVTHSIRSLMGPESVWFASEKTKNISSLQGI
jgi:hypothetical protein